MPDPIATPTLSLSTVESIGEWNSAYVGVITNVRHIRKLVPDDKLTIGISKVLEANAIGTLAILMGDVPYSEINNETIDDPKFDGQKNYFKENYEMVQIRASGRRNNRN